MKNLGKLMNGHAAGKLTGMAIGTLATIKGRRSNSIVAVIGIAGAAYFGKRILTRAKEEYVAGKVNEDFLGGLVVGLVGSAVAGAVVTGLVGEPRTFPVQTNLP